MSDIQLTGFELIEKIGEGGMGHVWKARQLSLDRIVAIKLLPSRYSRDPESVRQIVQEARTAARLKHPGIVQVYDASEDCGNYYFVMEFVDGYNVGQWIKRKNILPVYDALVVVESVVSALDYAWRTAGLIHCDIKPENIMVDQDGTIKVADLGLSLTQDSDLSTPSDEVAGTPGYISPEQVQGLGKLDCRTDIYALGCCLYQMVTGRRPFQELSDHEAMEAQVTSQIPDPRDVVAAISAPVCCLIERMLVKDPDKRLKDWQTVLRDLHRVHKGLMPVGAHPAEGTSTMRRRLGAKAGGNSTSQDSSENAARTRLPWKFLVLLLFAGVAAMGYFFFRKYEKSRENPCPVIPVVSVHQKKSDREEERSPGNEPGSVHSQVVQTASKDKDSLARALNKIKRVADDYESDGAFDAGIQWMENYAEEWIPETASNRMAIAAEFKRKLSERQDEREWPALTQEIATLVLSGKYTAARLRLEPAVKDAKYLKHSDELRDVLHVLTGIGGLSDKVLETFSADVGKVVTVGLSRGMFTGKVIEIRDRKVVCKTPDGMAQVDIHLEDLSLAERTTRLRRLESPEVFLVLGVMAYNDKRQAEAAKCLEKTGPVLGPLLTSALRDAVAKQVQDELSADPACMAFAKLIEQAGIRPQPIDLLRWREDIDGRRMDSETAKSVDRSIDAFLTLHAQSSFIGNNPGLILSLQKACGMALESASATTSGE